MTKIWTAIHQVVLAGAFVLSSSLLLGAGLAQDATNSQIVIEMVKNNGGVESVCPEYIPNRVSTEGEKQLCFRTQARSGALVGDILSSLPRTAPATPDDTDVYMTRAWRGELRAAAADDCVVDVVTNVKPNALSFDKRTGDCLFWIMDRSRCDDGTLVVLVHGN